MTPDPVMLQRLRAEKQAFFLPYYCEIVAQHPGGIEAQDVKRLVAEQIFQEVGINMARSAAEVLELILAWFESVHGATFESLNSRIGFNISSAALLAMYGSDSVSE